MKTWPEGDQYESLEELEQELKIGLEIGFEYAGKEWWIMPYGEEPGMNFSIYESYNEESYREYSSLDELLDGYRINGDCFRDLVTSIRVTFH